ncbi:hypothetical protein, partial [Wolbachia endosymbiont of Drosophila suzukii]|uniref:hypothetical protein n=1 Tax=Wolbachia endosymbiont of Drosophila suzukii TaxID=553633 RepID=UPI0005CB530C
GLPRTLLAEASPTQEFPTQSQGVVKDSSRQENSVRRIRKRGRKRGAVSVGAGENRFKSIHW